MENNVKRSMARPMMPGMMGRMMHEMKGTKFVVYAKYEDGKEGFVAGGRGPIGPRAMREAKVFESVDALIEESFKFPMPMGVFLNSEREAQMAIRHLEMMSRRTGAKVEYSVKEVNLDEKQELIEKLKEERHAKAPADAEARRQAFLERLKKAAEAKKAAENK